MARASGVAPSVRERKERRAAGRRPGGRARGRRPVPGRGASSWRSVAADGGGLQPLVEGASLAFWTRAARRRGVRPGLGRVARPGATTGRTGDPPGTGVEGRRPDDDRPRPEERREAAAGMPSDDGEVAISPDQAAAERLLARNARSLARVADPRQRRHAPTRCSPATASIPRSAARSPPTSK